MFPGSDDERNELCPTLSYTQRAYGFFGCLAVGFFLSILSWIAVFKKEWIMFGVLATISNITALASSCFLAGPWSQIKKMFEETRLIATIIYFIAMILTLVAALALQSGPLTIVACIFQYLAMVWYGLSYIPYARTAVKSIVKGLF
eukprot:PhF_6_TR37836/c0_g1_i1/m.56318